MPIDKSILAAKVQTSKLLADSERQYWITSLPTMTEEQCGKLAQILAEADAMPWTQEMDHYLSIAAKATTALAA